MPGAPRFVPAIPLVVAALLAVPAAAAEPTPERPAAAVMSPAEALSRAGHEATVEFVVRGGRRLDDKEICFLNSNKDHREPGTFTAVIFRAGLARFAADGVANPADEFLGKTIRVSGMVEERKGQAQIVVESPTQIEIVGGNEPVGPADQDR